jgi:hypothetical protein
MSRILTSRQSEVGARGQVPTEITVQFRGDEGDRTLDLRLAKPALYQLSYVPGDLSLLRSLFGLMASNRAFTLAVDT